MPNFNRKQHWEKIYKTKKMDEVSWYQPVPETSLAILENCALPKSAKIIDVGGGDSFFVDKLLDLGYQNITILDISEEALSKTQRRLGGKANQVTWIAADAADFMPAEQFDFWHDRAAFHFLTSPSEINKYKLALKAGVKQGGFLAIGTFSKQGPLKCSGIEIKQYSKESMTALLQENFVPCEFLCEDHLTPFGTTQNFIFGVFKHI